MKNIKLENKIKTVDIISESFFIVAISMLIFTVLYLTILFIINFINMGFNNHIFLMIFIRFIFMIMPTIVSLFAIYFSLKILTYYYKTKI